MADLLVWFTYKNHVIPRYLCPTPPVPSRYRRSLLALGSGDPTRAICSTFIAEAFQTLRYPILPVNLPELEGEQGDCTASQDYFRIRHHSLFAPRDFDASPYFDVVKPTLEHGFAGVTAIHAWRFAIATLAGMLPMTLVFAGLGNTFSLNPVLTVIAGMVILLVMVWLPWSVSRNRGSRLAQWLNLH